MSFAYYPLRFQYLGPKHMFVSQNFVMTEMRMKLNPRAKK